MAVAALGIVPACIRVINRYTNLRSVEPGA
jgi:hypothetical protein